MYNTWFFITDPIWNNEFSYQERIALWSQGKIWVPPLITWAIDNLEIGTEIAFEEVNDGKLISCKGLKNLIKTTRNGIPTYIFDNHDHALNFRHRHIKQFPTQEEAKPFVVLHIDQHSDLKEVVDNQVNVGNFITYALQTKLINDCIQMRTETALQNLSLYNSMDPSFNYILDIDMDFREKKSDQEIKEDFEVVRKLIQNACLVTIATSPYFLDQETAIKLVKKLLK